MPLTIKREPRPQAEEPGSSDSSLPSTSAEKEKSTLDRGMPRMGGLHLFLKEYSLAESFPQQYRVLRIWWAKLGSKAEMPKQSAELLQLRIGYELQVRDYIDQGFVLSAGVAQNLEAMRRFDVAGLTNRMRQMVQITAAKQEKEEEQDMAKKKEAKTNRTGVSHIYLEIFENQGKANLTDAQIVERVAKETGNAPTPKNVASYRCMFNAGELQGQKSAPSARVKAVRPKKDKAKKPMSEETKAKLKAYSAKKKASKKK